MNGPYVQLVQFRTVKESVDLVNNSKYGSCVSIHSQNLSLGKNKVFICFKNFPKITLFYKVMEVAYLLNVGTVWMNSFPIERGVQTRKSSGNYSLSGTKVAF